MVGLLDSRSLLESRLRDFGAELEESGVKKQTLPSLLSTAPLQAVRSVLQNSGLWSSDVRLSWVHFFKVNEGSEGRAIIVLWVPIQIQTDKKTHLFGFKRFAFSFIHIWARVEKYKGGVNCNKANKIGQLIMGVKQLELISGLFRPLLKI